MRTRIDWFNSAPFFLLHGVALSAFWIPFDWKWVGLCLAGYAVRMFGITAGYHRYFSHRSYKTGRVFQFGLAVLGGASFQKGALWWAAHHRHHHGHSDTDQDVHSPSKRGFWWSHMTWILVNDFDETKVTSIRDLMRYPELVWLNRYHWVPGSTYAAVLLVTGGWPAFVWGFAISTVLLWHGTFAINSLAHVFGSRRYATQDESRNNFWLALITFGEGWHNNHHAHMQSARQGFYWWEIDFTYYALRALNRLGLVWDLREPPLAELARRKVGA